MGPPWTITIFWAFVFVKVFATFGPKIGMEQGGPDHGPLHVPYYDSHPPPWRLVEVDYVARAAFYLKLQMTATDLMADCSAESHRAVELTVAVGTVQNFCSGKFVVCSSMY